MSNQASTPGLSGPVRRVWEYQLDLTARAQNLGMPSGAEVIHVKEQNSQPTLWVQVNVNEPLVVRTFCVFATGEDIAAAFTRYIGTVHIEWTVWHVYENPSSSDEPTCTCESDAFGSCVVHDPVQVVEMVPVEESLPSYEGQS